MFLESFIQFNVLIIQCSNKIFRMLNLFVFVLSVELFYLISITHAGYRYGKSLIPISDADEKAMKYETPRCLSLLGFTKRSDIKWHQTIGSGCQVVVANPTDQVCWL